MSPIFDSFLQLFTSLFMALSCDFPTDWPILYHLDRFNGSLSSLEHPPASPSICGLCYKTKQSKSLPWAANNKLQLDTRNETSSVTVCSTDDHIRLHQPKEMLIIHHRWRRVRSLAPTSLSSWKLTTKNTPKKSKKKPPVKAKGSHLPIERVQQ